MTGTAGPSPPNDGPPSASVPSAYQRALIDTIAAVRRRARLYRLLAALVLLLPAFAIAAAVARHSMALLAIALAAVPLFGLFRCADLWLLWRWERAVVALWRGGELDFASFRTAAEASRSLPRNTVAGMLDLLPTGTTIGGGTMPAERRAALAATMEIIASADHGTDGLRTVGRCALVTSIGLSATLWSWRPALFLGAPGLGLEAVAWLVPRVASAMWRRRFAHDPQREQLVAAARALDWRGLPRPVQ